MKPIGITEIQSGDLGNYASEYLDRIAEISNYIKHNSGVNTHIYLSSEDSSNDDLLRASLVLSDLTTLSLVGSGNAKVVLKPDPNRKFIFPGAIAKEHNLSADSKISFGVFQYVDNGTKKLCKQLAPFFKDQSLILKPLAITMFQKSDNTWHALPVVTAENDNEWIVNTAKQLDGELPMTLNTNSTVPFDLIIPYLRGLTWSDFHSVLNDATDSLVNLRCSIKKAMASAKSFDEKTLQERRMDTIEPEVATLERHFKKATTVHGIKIAGASVGAIALSLSAIAATGTMATVSGLLGAGGFGLLTREYAEYKGKLLELKDNPYYLFWRAAKRK